MFDDQKNSAHDLSEELEAIRKRRRVPAISAAAWVGGSVISLAAVGKRKVGSDHRVTVHDKWHVGSCTKAMTSMLAAILIERKHLSWATTVPEILESTITDIHNEWSKATIEQLLAHHGGAPDRVPGMLWKSAIQGVTSHEREQREKFVRELLLQAPKAVPGTKFIYSNSGYSIAGLMLETCLNRSWEDLITELVFDPLNMKSAGFGAPGGPLDAAEQPFGHRKINRKLSPVEPNELGDNPSAIAPAAKVHCSITDLLTFASGFAGGRTLVQPETLERLQRPYCGSDYSCGWYIVPREWGRGDVLAHDGSNTFWVASMWVAPRIEAAFVAASNGPPPSAQNACYDAINAMIAQTPLSHW